MVLANMALADDFTNTLINAREITEQMSAELNLGSISDFGQFIHGDFHVKRGKDAAVKAFNEITDVERAAIDAGGKLNLDKRWDNHLHLHRRYRDGFLNREIPRHNPGIVMYREITAKEAVSIKVNISYTTSCRIYLNGKKVKDTVLEKARHIGYDQEEVVLDLKEGVNYLLVKSVCLDGRKRGFYFSFYPYEKSDALFNSIVNNYSVETDWLTQCLPRPQVDDLGKSKALQKYLNGDTSFLLIGIENAIKDLGSAGTPFVTRFNAIKLQDPQGKSRELLDLFIQLCKERREQRLKTLASKYNKILFIKRIPVRPSFYAYTEGQSDGQTERHYHPGSALCMLDMSSGEPVVTTLIDSPNGVIRDIDVSYDADKALFAWKKGKDIGDDDYHLYEMDLKTHDIRQLTDGKGVADYEGRYLPNGDLIFSSTRCVQTIDCWQTETSNLYTCDKDGKLIRRLGFDQVHTTYPMVMNDGRILYTRWDYNDRGQTFPQPLFQMNFDGTGQTEYYGNNSWFPTTTHHARPIPDSNKVLAVIHGHHTWQAGKLAIIDRSKGTQEADGVQIVAPVRETKAVRVDGYGQDEELFRHPYPLNENEYVTAMTLDRRARDNRNSKFGIYYIDKDGNRELLHMDPKVSASHPIAVVKRKRPQMRPSTVDHTKDYGTYFMQDVYVGPGLKGVKRGTIKKLRVVALDFRAAPVGWTRSHGESGVSSNSTPISVGNATWDPKIILGETPVYADGSAMYKVPANTPVYFQCIDDKGQVAATMRSWSTLMPGETFSCVGCHEDKNYTPPVSKTVTAMKQGALELTPFYDIKCGFSFGKTIQPILDKHCTKCHDGSTEKKGKLLMDLTGKVVTGGDAKRKWMASYLNLVGAKVDGATAGQPNRKLLNWISSQSRPDMLPPYHAGSGTSKIVKMLRNGHGKAKLSQEELDKFCAWIDLAVPFCGDYLEANNWNNDEFNRYIRYQRKRERLAKEDRRNREAFYTKETGKELKLDDPDPRYLDYIEARGVAEPATETVEQGVQASYKYEFAEGWKAVNGEWSLESGKVLRNSSLEPGVKSFGPGKDWNDYTLTCKARRTGGAEGFSIIFRAQDPDNYYNWVVGGWGNSQQAIQKCMQGGPQKAVRLENNVWYDVKIEVNANTVKCYLNGKLQLEAEDIENNFGGIGFGSWSTQVEYKDILVRDLKGKELYSSKDLKAAKTVPGKESAAKTEKTGYRNLALNNGGEFPKASASDEYNAREFGAHNVINGKTSNKGHGKGFPSWGPNRRDDLWLKIDFGKTVAVNKAVIYVRADFKPYTGSDHDSWWKTGVMGFSDGSKVPFSLKKIADGQSITFKARRTKWVKFTDLVADDIKLWCGFSEIQIFGK